MDSPAARRLFVEPVSGIAPIARSSATLLQTSTNRQNVVNAGFLIAGIGVYSGGDSRPLLSLHQITGPVSISGAAKRFIAFAASDTLSGATTWEAGPSNYSHAISAAAKESFHRRSRRHCLSVLRSSRIRAWSEEIQRLHRQLSVR